MASGIDRFSVTVSLIGSSLVAQLTGEIDLANADEARTILMNSAAVLPPPDLVVLDLTAVTFLSAAAVHALQAFATAGSARGIRTHLVVKPDSIVSEVVFLSRLNEIVPTFATLEPES